MFHNIFAENEKLLNQKYTILCIQIYEQHMLQNIKCLLTNIVVNKFEI